MIPRALKVAALARQPEALLRQVNEELTLRGIFPTEVGISTRFC